MNELQIVKEIESTTKELQVPRMDKPIFPLQAMHRKELRKLKRDNCSNLHSRLQTIKSLKKDEFFKKYENKILEELEKRKAKYTSKIKKIEGINKKLFKMYDEIIKYYEISQEKPIYDPDKDIYTRPETHFSDDLFTVKPLNQFFYIVREMKKEGLQPRLDYEFRVNELKDKILSDKFNKMYGESFKKCGEMIDTLEQQYEEAINFGDLEQVKSIYYFLKDSEKFFEKVSKLKV